MIWTRVRFGVDVRVPESVRGESGAPESTICEAGTVFPNVFQYKIKHPYPKIPKISRLRRANGKMAKIQTIFVLQIVWEENGAEGAEIFRGVPNSFSAKKVLPSHLKPQMRHCVEPSVPSITAYGSDQLYF